MRLVAASIAWAVASLASDGGIEVEDEGDVRQGVTDGETIDGCDLGRVELASDTLVDRGGVEKTIGQDHGAGVESGGDDLTHELGAARGEKEQLGLGRHAVTGLGELQEVAQLLTDLRATGFPGEQDLVAETADRQYLEAREDVALSTSNAFFDLHSARLALDKLASHVPHWSADDEI